jgi:hypothetical protein
MPLAEFEPTISASERPQTRALDGAATGIVCLDYMSKMMKNHCQSIRSPDLESNLETSEFGTGALTPHHDVASF